MVELQGQTLHLFCRAPRRPANHLQPPVYHFVPRNNLNAGVDGTAQRDEQDVGRAHGKYHLYPLARGYPTQGTSDDASDHPNHPAPPAPTKDLRG